MIHTTLQAKAAAALDTGAIPNLKMRALFLLILGMCIGGIGNARAESERGWTVNYTGDLSGTVGGRIVVPGGTSMVAMVGGASMSEDMKSMGAAAISAKVMTLPGQPPSLKQLDITLADGTSCRLQPDGSERAKVINSSRKHYEAEFNGNLLCDGGKRVAVQARLVK